MIPDTIDKPKHYTHGGIETIDYMKAKLTDQEFRGYLKGNIIKYISRASLKDNETIDLKKAEWYLKYLINEVEDEMS